MTIYRRLFEEMKPKLIPERTMGAAVNGIDDIETRRRPKYRTNNKNPIDWCFLELVGNEYQLTPSGRRVLVGTYPGEPIHFGLTSTYGYYDESIGKVNDASYPIRYNKRIAIISDIPVDANFVRTDIHIGYEPRPHMGIFSHHIIFSYDAYGRLSEVRGRHDLSQRHPEWEDDNKIIAILKSGQYGEFSFSGSSKQAAGLSEKVLGVDVTSLILQPETTMLDIWERVTDKKEVFNPLESILFQG